MLKKIRSVVCSVVCCAGTVVVTDAIAMETGTASYYADRFQGHKTASGQEYDRNKLTAAHKTLPLGSQVEVINLKTHDSVIVTINDRGPYSSGRTLDLSYAAAKEIGLDRAGVAPVAINVLNAKDMNIKNVLPSEEIVEFEQLAKADEVEEAEEESAEISQAEAKPNDVTIKKTLLGKTHKAKVGVLKQDSTQVSKADAKVSKVEKQVSKATPAKQSEHHHDAKAKSETDAKKAKHLAVDKHQDKHSPKSEKSGKINKLAKADAVKHSTDAKVKKATHHKT